MATSWNSVLTDQQRQTYASDGVVHLPQVVALHYLEEISTLVDRQLEEPGPWVTDTGAEATTGRLFTSRYMWRTEPIINRFVFNSGVGELAAALMGSSSARFYFDHLLVKEAGTESAIPWHQDISYWPFLGSQICSVWVACTETSVNESSLEFVRGSHRWDKYFAPESFTGESSWTADFEGERCPDIEAARPDYDIIGFDVQPGDAIVFSAWTVRGAPGNAGPNRRVALSTRWLGDDALWSPHPGSDPSVTQADTIAVAGQYPADDDRFPLVWAR
ncbi:MAG TPA: phytanoyl-CoA dioxygenase [Acidimicrobiia bacterium]|nr:phytanoyl-CoA dioxygenase [Acidimicrobiia bacterium]